MPEEHKKEKWVTIVNRHYPPNPGVTGESAWDLSKYLIEKHDLKVKIVHVLRSDDGGGAIRKPIGEISAIHTIYKGKNPTLKSLSGFMDGLSLIIKTLFIKKGPVICMSSPPLLPFWASIFFTLFRVKWVFWSMDLFPESFVATKVMKADSVLYKIVKYFTYRNKPQLLVSLGPKQADHILENYKNKPSTLILPCGVFIDYQKDHSTPPWKLNDGKIYFGYCGNLGAPHSVDFLKVFIDTFDPAQHHLILATYGPNASEILEYAKGKTGITILPGVPRNQLHFIDVHLVSLNPEYTHTAVPSKGISSVCTGGTVLFYGSEEADTWVMLKESSWFINPKGNLSDQLKNFIEQITKEEILRKKENSIRLAKQLHDMEVNAYEKIASFIKEN